jgi:hypothetical protein
MADRKGGQVQRAGTAGRNGGQERQARIEGRIGGKEWRAGEQAGRAGIAGGQE